MSIGQRQQYDDEHDDVLLANVHGHVRDRDAVLVESEDEDEAEQQ